eukprot:TRINITY_DN28041_c0_g1_i1.p1 TRINITY_DN28041_c0_g1~~TRINITY_DN28041_c0_g1_i1.p1  ORF type:complete len:396 (+),score=117.70 TRINITY_DN28041_c0_g1_i1:85-1188(+)
MKPEPKNGGGKKSFKHAGDRLRRERALRVEVERRLRAERAANRRLRLQQLAAQALKAEAERERGELETQLLRAEGELGAALARGPAAAVADGGATSVADGGANSGTDGGEAQQQEGATPLLGACTDAEAASVIDQELLSALRGRVLLLDAELRELKQELDRRTAAAAQAVPPPPNFRAQLAQCAEAAGDRAVLLAAGAGHWLWGRAPHALRAAVLGAAPKSTVAVARATGRFVRAARERVEGPQLEHRRVLQAAREAKIRLDGRLAEARRLATDVHLLDEAHHAALVHLARIRAHRDRAVSLTLELWGKVAELQHRLRGADGGGSCSPPKTKTAPPSPAHRAQTTAPLPRPARPASPPSGLRRGLAR